MEKKRRPSHGFGKMRCQPDTVRGFIRRNDRRCSEYNGWNGVVLHLRLCRVQRREHFRYCRKLAAVRCIHHQYLCAGRSC